MSATDLYREGRLAAAIDAQLEEVRAHPLDQSKRLFLFELLCFSGDLERARRQLDVLKYDDADLERAVTGYRLLLDSEQSRRAVYSRGTVPEVLGNPSEHVRLRLEALPLLRSGDRAAAAEQIARAAAAAPAVRATLNGRPADGLRDADDLLAGVLEVMAQGRYFWVGLEQVRLVATNPPRFPRDLLYIPARLEIETESGDVFLPALYPGSHDHPDDQVKLGRLTEWITADPGPTLGVGLHTYFQGDEMISLLEWREYQATEA